MLRSCSMRPLLLCLLFVSVGCDAPPDARTRVGSTLNTSPSADGMLPGEDSLNDLDFGEDWDAVEQHLDRSQDLLQTSGASSGDLRGFSGSQITRREPEYGIVMTSFGKVEG